MKIKFYFNFQREGWQIKILKSKNLNTNSDFLIPIFLQTDVVDLVSILNYEVLLCLGLNDQELTQLGCKIQKT